MPKSTAKATGPNPGLIALIVLAGVVVVALVAFGLSGSGGKSDAPAAVIPPSNPTPPPIAGTTPAAAPGAPGAAAPVAPGSAAFDPVKMAPKPRR